MFCLLTWQLKVISAVHSDAARESQLKWLSNQSWLPRITQKVRLQDQSKQVRAIKTDGEERPYRRCCMQRGEERNSWGACAYATRFEAEPKQSATHTRTPTQPEFDGRHGVARTMECPAQTARLQAEFSCGLLSRHYTTCGGVSSTANPSRSFLSRLSTLNSSRAASTCTFWWLRRVPRTTRVCLMNSNPQTRVHNWITKVKIENWNASKLNCPADSLSSSLSPVTSRIEFRSAPARKLLNEPVKV